MPDRHLMTNVDIQRCLAINADTIKHRIDTKHTLVHRARIAVVIQIIEIANQIFKK